MADNTTAPLRKRLGKILAKKVPKRNKARLSAMKPRLSPAHREVIDAWFANGCVSKRRAMLAAGYTNTTSASPVTVFGREDVQNEIARRRALAASKTAVTEDWVIEQYRKLASASLGDLLEVNEDGSAYLDMNGMNDDQRAALVQFESETYNDKQFREEGEQKLDSGDISEYVAPVPVVVVVKKTKVKFASRQAALDSLARILGMNKDKVEVSGVVSLAEKIAASRKRINAEANAGASTPAPDGG